VQELNKLLNQYHDRNYDAVVRIIAKWRGERDWGVPGAAEKVEERVWRGTARMNFEQKASERKEW
jgi:hypothetical protein